MHNNNGVYFVLMIQSRSSDQTVIKITPPIKQKNLGV